MKKYQFRNIVFHPPFAPYYDAYKGHTFVIDHIHPDPAAEDHMWLTCISDLSVIVQGYVETDFLTEVA